MKLLVHFTELFVGDVGVDLGGGDIGVAEHHLHTADVGAIGEEIGRKGVAKHMGSDFL